MNKAIIYLIFFTLYTLMLLWFGKDGFKKTNNLKDFFVAGNSLGLLASIFTFTATWFSAASMQGLTGSICAYGYAMVLYSVVPWFIGAAFLVSIVPRLKAYDILTVPEYFRIRYDSRLLQAMGGCIIIFSYTLYMIIQIRGFGVVMSELLDINYTLAIILVYLFIVYSTFGGLFSVAKTDGLNFVLIVLGILLASGMILRNTEGILRIHEQAAEIATKPFPRAPFITEQGALLDPFSKGLYPPLMIITGFCGWGLGLAGNPQYALRIISARNKKTAVNMICYSVLILAIIYLGIFIIGLGSRVLQPSIDSIDSVDEVFPYMINKVIYSRFSGLVLIGITAAAVSTANSQLLILASGFTYDILKNYSCLKIDEGKYMNLNRIFILLSGTISLILSINPPQSLLIYGSQIWGVFSVTFLLPLYGGLFWKKATKEGAIASFVGGLATMIAFVLKYKFTEADPSNVIHPALPGVIAAIILFYSISKYTYGRKGDSIETRH
ncbi:sodium:solute symporter family protein [Geosporobacter ferrireducens]|uniref:sodium:solute symporter family protein n=1 Tax=Geosporobacter ferrireducens TaxID=1424294 RepID=UPI00139B2E4A|nr:sodium:solute symporter family protein [Geosporobacter ferrireducens]MTI57146.1 sodium:solute symporter family protein [Geosporobacter ferrireducens]